MKSFRKYISELRENTKLPKDTITVLQADDDKYDRGLRVKYGKDGSYTIQYWINDSDKVAEIEVEIDGKSVKKNAKNIKLLYHPQLKEEKGRPTRKALALRKWDC